MVKRHEARHIMEHDRPKMRYLESDGVYPVREDSMLLLESVMQRMAGRDNGLYLDMGCGTGLCSMAASILGWEVFSADRNPRALSLTRRNMELNRLGSRYLLTDLFAGVPGALKGRFDMMSFNPPYLSGDPDLPHPLERTALFGGPSGMELALSFVVLGKEYLAPDGEMVMVMPKAGLDRLLQELAGSHVSVSPMKMAAGSDEDLTAFSVRPLKTC